MYMYYICILYYTHSHTHITNMYMYYICILYYTYHIHIYYICILYYTYSHTHITNMYMYYICILIMSHMIIIMNEYIYTILTREVMRSKLYYHNNYSYYGNKVPMYFEIQITHYDNILLYYTTSHMIKAGYC